MDLAHIAHQILAGLNWTAVNIPWDAVVASGILSGLMVGPYKKIKKWFDHHEAIIVTLIGLLGPAIVAVWSYVLHHYGTDPRLVAVQGLAVAFMTQPFYIIIIKPTTRRLSVWITKQVLEAQKLNSSRDTAQENVQEVSVPDPVVPVQDFKP